MVQGGEWIFNTYLENLRHPLQHLQIFMKESDFRELAEISYS